MTKGSKSRRPNRAFMFMKNIIMKFPTRRRNITMIFNTFIVFFPEMMARNI